MAITYDITKTTNQLFKEQPDTTVDVKIDGVKHAWKFHNRGAFLATELTRWASELQSFGDMNGDAMTDDEQRQLMQQYNKANDRLEYAFKAQVTSKDNSSDRWIEANISNPTIVANVLSGILKALNGEKAAK